MGGEPNRSLRTENSKNPVAGYQHKNYLAPPPPPRLKSTTPSAGNAQSAKIFLTDVRKILDPPLGCVTYLRILSYSIIVQLSCRRIGDSNVSFGRPKTFKLQILSRPAVAIPRTNIAKRSDYSFIRCETRNPW